MPFLSSISHIEENFNPEEYPFNIPALSKGINLPFTTNVTFLVGENGTGKSTLLEGIAAKCNLNLTGGNQNHYYRRDESESALAPHLRLRWDPVRISNGFFMRAESFFNFATYIDQLAARDGSALDPYGGKSLHEQSHGESFLSLFANRFSKGIYLLDEPEAALSPQRQLAFLSIIHELEQASKAQFIIATHSPILIAYPGATVYQIDEEGIEMVDYRETAHFSFTKNFLNDPERYLYYLLGDE